MHSIHEQIAILQQQVAALTEQVARLTNRVQPESTDVNSQPISAKEVGLNRFRKLQNKA